MLMFYSNLIVLFRIIISCLWTFLCLNILRVWPTKAQVLPILQRIIDSKTTSINVNHILYLWESRLEFVMIIKFPLLTQETNNYRIRWRWLKGLVHMYYMLQVTPLILCPETRRDIWERSHELPLWFTIYGPQTITKANKNKSQQLS